MRVSARQLALFRVALGAYLAIHFLQLVPYGPELFSNAGVFPEAELLPFSDLAPNPLEGLDSPLSVAVFLWILVFLSILLAVGWARPVVAILVWFGWACLFQRNPLIANPSIPYVGSILLLIALVPRGEGLVPGRTEDPAWRFPSTVYWVSWFLLAAGYSYSGAVKLGSPSWIDGSALEHLLHNPLARPGPVRDLLLNQPRILKALTWAALALELVALPASFHPKTRALSWTALFGLQVGILTVVSFADLTVGMLLTHLFVFDRTWIPRR